MRVLAVNTGITIHGLVIKAAAVLVNRFASIVAQVVSVPALGAVGVFVPVTVIIPNAWVDALSILQVVSLHAARALAILPVVRGAHYRDGFAFIILQEISLETLCACSCLGHYVAIGYLDGLCDAAFETLQGIARIAAHTVSICHIVCFTEWV